MYCALGRRNINNKHYTTKAVQLHMSSSLLILSAFLTWNSHISDIATRSVESFLNNGIEFGLTADKLCAEYFNGILHETNSRHVYSTV
jgi:hypothetical protein